MNHLRQYCDKKCNRTDRCMYCEDFICLYCEGYKSSRYDVCTLTTDCVGRLLTAVEMYAILNGVINYRDHHWIFESKEEGEKRDRSHVHPFLCDIIPERTNVERSVKCLHTK